MLFFCCQVQLSEEQRQNRIPSSREEEAIAIFPDPTRGIADIMAQQVHRRTQKNHSRLCEAASKLSDSGFSMLRVHSLISTGTIAIHALEIFFLTELQGNYIHVQLQSSGECLVPETSQV